MYKCRKCGELIKHEHYGNLCRAGNGRPWCPECDCQELNEITVKEHNKMYEVKFTQAEIEFLKTAAKNAKNNLLAHEEKIGVTLKEEINKLEGLFQKLNDVSEVNHA